MIEEFLLLNQALRKAQGHGSIIGPLAGLQVKRASSDHIRNPLEASRPLEFEHRSDSVPHGKSEEASSISLRNVHK